MINTWREERDYQRFKDKMTLASVVVAVGLVIYLLGVWIGWYWPRHDEYRFSFNSQDSLLEYALFEPEKATELSLSCPVSRRLNTLFLIKNGEYIAFKALCGKIIKEVEVDY